MPPLLSFRLMVKVKKTTCTLKLDYNWRHDVTDKKFSCCCDSRSHCCKNWVISVFNIVIATSSSSSSERVVGKDRCALHPSRSSRPVNKNVSTGAVRRAKPGTKPGVHNWLLQVNYHIGIGPILLVLVLVLTFCSCFHHCYLPSAGYIARSI